MKTSTKAVFALVGALVIAGAIYGAYQYPIYQQIANTSAVGSTFNNAKVAAIQFTPTAPGATSTSILNTDASDRYVLSNFVACSNATTSYTAVTGAGLANLIFSAATSSASAPAVNTNTNLVMNNIIATGTVAAGVASNFGGNVLQASSTIASSSLQINAFANNYSAGANAYKSVWASGTYLSFFANATNTAQCTVGVYYLPS